MLDYLVQELLCGYAGYYLGVLGGRWSAGRFGLIEMDVGLIGWGNE